MFLDCFVGDVLGIEVERTWEFNASQPLRSVMIPQLLLGPCFHLVTLLSVHLPVMVGVQALVCLPRLTMAFLSLFSDRLVYNIATHHTSAPDNVMFVYTSSYIVLIYLTRTLSNTTEAFLFTALLYVTTVKSSSICKKPNLFNSCLLKNECVLAISMILTLGLFNRPTFMLFAFMPYMYWLFNKHNSLYIVSRIFHTALYSAMFCLAIVLWDTSYYKQVNIVTHVISAVTLLLTNGTGVIGEFSDQFIVTPFNFIRYNTKQANLEEHGLHAAYQHMLVNIPLLLGPMALLMFYKIVMAVNGGGRFSRRVGLFLSAAMVPVVILSWFSHQEPRFLIPVVVPVAVLVALFHIKSRLFYTLWILFNILCCLFYGVLHQGGLITAISQVRYHVDNAPIESSKHVIFYHTYMPPRYLFALDGSEKLEIQDLKGADDSQLTNTINSINLKCPKCKIYVVMPSTLASDICAHRTNILPRAPHLLLDVQYHLSMEDPPNLGECMSKQTSMSYYNSDCTESVQSDVSAIGCLLRNMKLDVWTVENNLI